MRKKKWLLIHISAFLGTAIYMAVVLTLDLGCPIRNLIGFPCPGCGITRATLCLLRLDFAGAWRMNPAVFFAYPYLFFLLHYQTRFFAGWKRWIKASILFGGAGLFLLIYFIRLSQGLIP